MKNNKNLKTILLGVILMVLAVAGATYAYFTATISDGDKGSSVIIQTGTLRLVYSDTEYINVSGVLPGDSYTKTVTVTNEGNVPVNYNLVWIELLNELTTRTDLTMEISCASNTDTCAGVPETLVASSGTNIPIKKKIAIGMLETHTYTIVIHFNETGSNQNDNQGKIISGKIGIVETDRVNIAGTLKGPNHNMYYTGEYYGLSQSITSIEIQNTINIPGDAVSTWDVSADGTSTVMAYIKSNGSSGYNLYIQANGSIAAPINSASLFGTYPGFTALTSLTGLEYLETTNTTDMNNMFYYCGALTSLDISNFDTSNVTNMNNMFYGVGVSSLDLSSFDTSNVTNMSGMFSSMANLTTLNIESLNVSKVTTMEYMFNGVSKLTTLDLSGFDTSSLQNFSQMFGDMAKLTSLNLSNFDTSNVTEMSAIFYNCSSLTSLDLSSFDTSSVTTMYQMFMGMTKLTTLNVSSFNTSNVLNMNHMFQNMSNMVNLNISNFNTAKVTSMQYMFGGMFHLATIDFRNASFGAITNSNYMFSGDDNFTIYAKDSAAKTFLDTVITNAYINGTVTIV